MTDPAKASPDEIGYADAVAELDDILAQLDDDGITGLVVVKTQAGVTVKRDEAATAQDAEEKQVEEALIPTKATPDAS